MPPIINYDIAPIVTVALSTLGQNSTFRIGMVAYTVVGPNSGGNYPCGRLGEGATAITNIPIVTMVEVIGYTSVDVAVSPA